MSLVKPDFRITGVQISTTVLYLKLTNGHIMVLIHQSHHSDNVNIKAFIL